MSGNGLRLPLLNVHGGGDDRALPLLVDRKINDIHNHIHESSSSDDIYGRLESLEKRYRSIVSSLSLQISEAAHEIAILRSSTHERLDDCDRIIRRQSHDIMALRERLSHISMDDDRRGPLSPLSQATPAHNGNHSSSNGNSLDTVTITLMNQRFASVEKLYRDEQSRRSDDHEQLLGMIHDCKRDASRLVRAERDRRHDFESGFKKVIMTFEKEIRDTISTNQKQNVKLIAAIEDIVRTEIESRQAGERKTNQIIDERYRAMHTGMNRMRDDTKEGFAFFSDRLRRQISNRNDDIRNTIIEQLRLYGASKDTLDQLITHVQQSDRDRAVELAKFKRAVIRYIKDTTSETKSMRAMDDSHKSKHNNNNSNTSNDDPLLPTHQTHWAVPVAKFTVVPPLYPNPLLSSSPPPSVLPVMSSSSQASLSQSTSTSNPNSSGITAATSMPVMASSSLPSSRVIVPPLSPIGVATAIQLEQKQQMRIAMNEQQHQLSHDNNDAKHIITAMNNDKNDDDDGDNDKETPVRTGSAVSQARHQSHSNSNTSIATATATAAATDTHMIASINDNNNNNGTINGIKTPMNASPSSNRSNVSVGVANPTSRKSIRRGGDSGGGVTGDNISNGGRSGRSGKVAGMKNHTSVSRHDSLVSTKSNITKNDNDKDTHAPVSVPVPTPVSLMGGTPHGVSGDPMVPLPSSSSSSSSRAKVPSSHRYQSQSRISNTSYAPDWIPEIHHRTPSLPLPLPLPSTPLAPLTDGVEDKSSNDTHVGISASAKSSSHPQRAATTIGSDVNNTTRESIPLSSRGAQPLSTRSPRTSRSLHSNTHVHAHESHGDVPRVSSLSKQQSTNQPNAAHNRRTKSNASNTNDTNAQSSRSAHRGNVNDDNGNDDIRNDDMSRVQLPANAASTPVMSSPILVNDQVASTDSASHTHDSNNDNNSHDKDHDTNNGNGNGNGHVSHPSISTVIEPYNSISSIVVDTINNKQVLSDTTATNNNNSNNGNDSTDISNAQPNTKDTMDDKNNTNVNDSSGTVATPATTAMTSHDALSSPLSLDDDKKNTDMLLDQPVGVDVIAPVTVTDTLVDGSPSSVPVPAVVPINNGNGNNNAISDHDSVWGSAPTSARHGHGHGHGQNNNSGANNSQLNSPLQSVSRAIHSNALDGDHPSLHVSSLPTVANSDESIVAATHISSDDKDNENSTGVSIQSKSGTSPAISSSLATSHHERTLSPHHHHHTDTIHTIDEGNAVTAIAATTTSDSNGISNGHIGDNEHGGGGAPLTPVISDSNNNNTWS